MPEDTRKGRHWFIGPLILTRAALQNELGGESYQECVHVRVVNYGLWERLKAFVFLNKQTVNNLKKWFSSERNSQDNVSRIALWFVCLFPIHISTPSKIAFLLLTVVILKVGSGWEIKTKSPLNSLLKPQNLGIEGSVHQVTGIDWDGRSYSPKQQSSSLTKSKMPW